MPEPRINPQFPVWASDNLSPPIVQPPIHPCALAVFVYGFVPGATVRMYANSSELVGQDEPVVGFATLKVSLPLSLGEAITATQAVGPIVSAHSHEPVVVSPYPRLRRPVVGPDLYACGRVVPAANLAPSTHVEVWDDDTGEVIGTGETTGEWEAIVTSPLREDHKISEIQIACPTTAPVSSERSAAVIVQAQPSPPLAPVVERPVVGTSAVTLHQLYVGAEAQVEQGAPIGGGLANAPDNWVPVDPPVAGSPLVQATQTLCSLSRPSRKVAPIDRIPAPVLGAPICAGSRYVTVDGTTLNANVVLLRGGSIIGYSGAALGTLRLAIGGGVAYWLVALDYRDGRELARTHVTASLWRADGSAVNFTAKNQVDRPALLLDHGAVYAAFGMRFREEIIEYHGWVVRFRASDLAVTGAFCTSRNATVPDSPFTTHTAEGAGIWQGGAGLAADPDGNVYFLTGNATADIANDFFGDTFVRLTPTPTGLVASAFVPDGVDRLREHDVDIGSGGAMTFPDLNLVVGGGKTGYMYLLHRDSMRLEQHITASTNLYDPSRRDQGWDVGPHLHGSPTYWRGPDHTYGYFYVWGEKDVLRLFRFNTSTGRFDEPEVRRGPARALEQAMPGGMMSVSANGNAAGTGIVWATLPTSHLNAPDANAHPGRLYAFNAENLDPLWDTAFPSLGKWLLPTIADGKVFIGTSSRQLIVYELGRPGATRWRGYRPFQPQDDHMMPPMHHRYEDEESIRALAGIALNQLAAPPGLERVTVVEGDGSEGYEGIDSTDNKGELVWQPTGATASLLTVAGRSPEPPLQLVKVELLPGPVWQASDGSAASGRVERSFPAPEPRSVPWQAYAVTSAGRQGLFATVVYIRRMFTFGGAVPSAPPKSKGERQGVPFHAQYVLYERPD